MQRLFISVAALQFALSVATAQPAPTSTATQSASLDQRSNVSEIRTKKTAKPLVHLELLSAPETVVVLPVVALHLLLTGLIGGATSESGIASVYAGGRTASGEWRASAYQRHDRCAPFHTVWNEGSSDKPRQPAAAELCFC